jgi:hypothetical protein
MKKPRVKRGELAESVFFSAGKERKMRVLGVIMLVALLLSGCEFFEPEETVLETPQNVRLIAIDDGLGVRLEWDAVADAEEYAVHFNSSEFARVTATQFEHRASEVERDGLGTYFVFAFKDEDRSPQSDPVSSKPKSVITQEIYDRDDVVVSDTTIQTRYDSLGVEYVDTSIVTEMQLGGYGWTEAGSGEGRDIGDVSEIWQVYLDDGAPGETDYTNFHLVSANAALPGMAVPAAQFDTAYISGPCTTDYAPTDMSVTASVEINATYYLNLYGMYFVKIVPTEYTSVTSTFIDYTDMQQPPGGGPEVPLERTHEQPNVGVIFEYSFHKIENFRRF